jgi:rod shape-determining protein MreC
MRNLFRFLIKNFNLLFFVILLFISSNIFIQESSFHKSAYINTTTSFIGKIDEIYSNFNEYLYLKKVNDSLAAENANLRSLIPSSIYQNFDTTIIVKDSFNKPLYKYICAKVISRTTDQINNYAIINKGWKDGIKSNWGVITKDGILGITKDVSENYSSIITLLHSKNHVSVSVKTSQFASLVWNGYDAMNANINGIPKHVKIRVGDTVYTSEESKFPPKLMVGTISNYDLSGGGNFYNVKVKLSTDFFNLNYVYVVESFAKKELDSLTNKFIQDNVD